MELSFIYFSALSTAVQCAVFLIGNLSPIVDAQQKQLCAQHVFKHIFLDSFLPLFSSDYGRQTVTTLFANHSKAMAGFLKFCQAPFINNPVFDDEVVDWLIDLIKVFESKSVSDAPLLSTQFRQFVDRMMEN
ncbi:hypothetical protein BAC3_01967 [uncultured bacterium]|nr:hypothetical protein BAC3_01967 [uncultured bacterium]